MHIKLQQKSEYGGVNPDVQEIRSLITAYEISVISETKKLFFVTANTIKS